MVGPKATTAAMVTSKHRRILGGILGMDVAAIDRLSKSASFEVVTNVLCDVALHWCRVDHNICCCDCVEWISFSRIFFY